MGMPNTKNHRRDLLVKGAFKLLLLGAALSGLIIIGEGFYIKSKAVLAQRLLVAAWNDTLTTQNNIKAWPWADTFPVASIEVPGKSNGSVIALDGSSGEALAFAPGHLNNTAQPGQRGTAIYAAHRDTHLAFLEYVTEDDIIEVTDNKGRLLRYQVDSLHIAPWDQSGIADNNFDKRIALITCWPFNAKTPGPLRYIVEGHLVE